MTATMKAAGRADLGVIGLGVMGENLALNVTNHGFSVALWNRTEARVERVIQRAGPNRQWIGTKTLEEFAAALSRPRRILLLIKAGAPVDERLDELVPLLSPDDVVIDGGNSYVADTQRREVQLRTRGVRFVGMGVSGGEEGGRYGPSLMPGGTRASDDHLQPILEAIAARTDPGPYVTYVGPDGAGHFVKMVHNGIEYGVMQAIAEAYDLLRRALSLPTPETADLFAEWNRGPMASYLIEITSQVLSARDPETGHPLVEMMTPAADDASEITTAVRDALFAATLCAYAQGMALLRAGSIEHGWNVDLREVARVWTGRCIIRASLLGTIMQGWRRTVQMAVAQGIPVPAVSASLDYFDSYRTAVLPQNLTQAQRNYFGAHTYQRIDRPAAGCVHTDWQALITAAATRRGGRRVADHHADRGGMDGTAATLEEPLPGGPDSGRQAPSNT